MIPDMDRQRQFNDILDAADGDSTALLAAASMLQERDAGMAANLRLIAHLRQVAPPRSEIESARLRIGQRVTREVLANISPDDARAAPLRPLRLSEPPASDGQPCADHMSPRRTLTAPPHTQATTGAQATPTDPPAMVELRWRHIRNRAAMGVVAAALLLLALGVGLSYASADSLPGSPLYSIKRGEEALLLTLPANVESQARTLSMIAMRRLIEAQAEAHAHHDTQAAALLKQYNDAMVRLISLDAMVKAQHGDTTVIADQIAQVLAVQSAIQQATSPVDDPNFASALNNSAATVQQALDQRHIATPNANGGANPGKGHGNQPGATPTNMPTASPTGVPTVSPTPPPAPSPTPSGGHGHNHGHAATGSSAEHPWRAT